MNVPFIIKSLGDPPLVASFPSVSSRLSQNLDGVVIEFLFRQSKISEVLGGSGYNSDRLCLPYVPQLTGRPFARALPRLPLAVPQQNRA